MQKNNKGLDKNNKTMGWVGIDEGRCIYMNENNNAKIIKRANKLQVKTPLYSTDVDIAAGKGRTGNGNRISKEAL